MDDKKNLILIKNEDKTDAVKYCSYNDGKRDITFINGKKYTYSYDNVVWLSNPKELDLENVILYENNVPLSGIEKILVFDEIYVKLFFQSGYKKLYNINELRIEENVLNGKDVEECFLYLKELSNIVGISDKYGDSFLGGQYKHIKQISSESVLANYLLKEDIIENNNYSKHFIFPFGFNISQKDALGKAMNNKMSIIEGPPGTGKTQTILNIIANALINEKTVAVVSNNNSATANVIEKLAKYDLDFIAAYLGSNDNKDKFFSNQNNNYPELHKWKIDNDKKHKLNDELAKSQENLNNMLISKNKLSQLNLELSNIRLEYEYYQKENDTGYTEILGYKTLFKQTADNVMNMIVQYEIIAENQKKMKFTDKVKFLFKYGVMNFKFYNNSNENILSYLRNKYYILKINELKNSIAQLEESLGKYNFEEEMDLYSTKSMKLFKNFIFEKYSKNKTRRLFGKDVLWKNFKEFINEYPVILSTTHSLRGCACNNYLFDYVIMDEASQIDVVTGALSFSCAKNVVVVGDLKQLPNVVSSDVKNISDNIFNKYKLDEPYRYSKNSILSSVDGLFTNIPKTLLREHYRCSPKIIDFCNKKFYNDELIILTSKSKEESPLKLYKTVEGNHARGHYNQRQIDVIINEIIPNLNHGDSIGIITPYRDQVNELKKQINDKDIQIDTVHKYQGREKDIIILSTVANEKDEFVDDSNLLNVAISRAVKQLIVIVADNDEIMKNGNIGDLIKYIDYNNFEVINSSIYSVFDLLYSSYSEKRLLFYKKYKKVSEYDSENIINSLIEKVLAKEQFSNLDRVMHYPLRNIIKDKEKLSEEELKYAMNILTHTDFLIFNKFDKMPVLVVEVDGYKFHNENEKQLKRDKMKDEILHKMGINILRLKTNESREEERLIKALKEVPKGD